MIKGGASDRRAWGEFWQARRGESGFPRETLQRIEAMQQRCWEDFARLLPNAARVIDLGTGSGVVLMRLRRVRPDLELVGIDSAPKLPQTPRGILLRSGVPMEALPFADGSFAAVTSQFGYEYGDTAAIAGEVARVLRGGGQMRLLMHHAESPIVAHHERRRAALFWAVRESGSLEQAREFLNQADYRSANIPPIIRSAAGTAASRYPSQTVAEEFVAAVVQTLELGRAHTPEKVLAALDVLEERANSELRRLESLRKAACDSERVERIRGDLQAAGVESEAASVLLEPARKVPFGWLLNGHRASAAGL